MDVNNPSAAVGRMVPMGESAGAGAAGAMGVASPIDHQHPSTRSVTIVVLGATGTTTDVLYTRLFDLKPGIIPVAINPSGRPVTVEVVDDIKDANGKFIGCKIRGYRNQLLPGLSGIIVLGPLLTALGNFDVFGGSAQGAEVRVTAVPQTVTA